jgi:hypothetical protein
VGVGDQELATSRNADVGTARWRKHTNVRKAAPAIRPIVAFCARFHRFGSISTYNAGTPGIRYGGEVVKFKPLLERWKQDPAPALTADAYAIRLPLDDASRLHALAQLFPGRKIEDMISDLLHAALDEIAAAMPYERGSKIISRDDHGDPLYEDVGLTPRFVELTRQFQKTLADKAAKPT